MKLEEYTGQDELEGDSVYTLPMLDKECPLVKQLLHMMEQTTIPVSYERKNTGIGRSQPFGIVYKKWQGHKYSYAVNNRDYPDLYKAILDFASHYVPIPFYAIQVNVNYEALPHYDKNNIGHSYILALGEYEGGEFCVDGKKLDIAYKPIIVDATKNEHSVEKIHSGKRYSFVFFTGKEIGGKKPSDVGTPYDYFNSQYRIAIPSYKRYEELKKKTIHTLLECGYTQKDIDIFVSNEEEKKEYEKVLPEYNYIVSNTMGLSAKKKFMSEYYPEGQHILHIDDDIEKILYLPEGAYKQGEFKKAVEELFCMMKKHNTILGGFYPVSNTFFMKERWEKGLVFIVGSLYCFINDRSITYTTSSAEDHQRLLQTYKKYGNVIRYCGIAGHTKYWTNKGGITASETDREKKDYEDKTKLVEDNMELCKLIQKKNKQYDIKYNRKLRISLE